MRNTMNKKKKHSRYLAYAGIVLLLIGIVAAILFLKDPDQATTVSDTTYTDYHTHTYEDVDYAYNSSITTILLLGIDSEDPDNEQGQADVISLLLLDRENEQIELLNIPRDTMTEILLSDIQGNSLGWQRQHLNLAYAYGRTPEDGCMNTAQAVSRLLYQVPIPKYAAIDLSRIDEMHAIVGDLEVVIPNDSLSYLGRGWREGQTITLTEENLETYLRSRDTEENFSNTDRMERQEAYLKAYIGRLKELLETDQEGTIRKVSTLLEDITTNISYSDVQVYSEMLLSYSYDPETDIHLLPGTDTVGELHDEYEPDKAQVEEMVIELFYRKESE